MQAEKKLNKMKKRWWWWS